MHKPRPLISLWIRRTVGDVTAQEIMRWGSSEVCSSCVKAEEGEREWTSENGAAPPDVVSPHSTALREERGGGASVPAQKTSKGEGGREEGRTAGFSSSNSLLPPRSATATAAAATTTERRRFTFFPCGLRSFNKYVVVVGRRGLRIAR
ncbi:unnamed protein product [Lampetra planeri]